jgi:hypothetical protein
MNSRKILDEQEIEELGKALSRTGQWIILAKDVLPRPERAKEVETVALTVTA